ncbi:sensor histidine kinase [Spirilliplanes yamanashiensis]|uniref:histidine kinase n=1 Tax=Spirilliplanes yamanashiensis TaxID=42233 RepID=A0A8J4DKJ6_9ACTN|nr:histidine kinase [Spirilliplanes yamanashiensis]MDP9817553.1 signal transduction histidine kinase [Spirilliplanes yamanashiensis]GIJ04363.1 hypothetical protein Sya03_37150 [Spirilliplanes yamanashiensis]
MSVTELLLRVLAGLRGTVAGADPPPASRGRLARSTLTAGACVVLGVGMAMVAYNDLADANLIGWLRLLLAAGIGAPITLLPRLPLVAWRIALPVALASVLIGVAPAGAPLPWHAAQLVFFPVVLFLVALRHPGPVVFWVWAATTTLGVLWTEPENVAGLVIVLTLIAVVGDQARRRGEAQRRLVAEREVSELEQARRAVLEERARIARELHDVVAHHMSLIAVRAETAPFRVTGGPEAQAAEFASIAGAAREALGEMRRLLGVLRSESGGPDLAPQPGLADLPAMVAAARRAGLTVELVCPATEVPEAVGLSAYRIVQEGLSNATRHAAGAAVRIDVVADDAALAVTIRNDRPDRPAAPGADGAGLAGMRERAAVHGGEVTAGPTPDGGYEVRARLPLGVPA